MLCLDRIQVAIARACAHCLRGLARFSCVRSCVLKVSRVTSAIEGPPGDQDEILASALERYGFSIEDLRALADSDNEQAPHVLSVEDRVVRRLDDAAIGNVRLQTGRSMPVYSARLETPQRFSDKRMYLFGRTKTGATCVVGLVTRPFCSSRLRAQKPLGSVRVTDQGRDEPYDDFVAKSLVFLLSHAA